MRSSSASGVCSISFRKTAWSLVNGDDPNCVEVAKDCLAQMIEVGFSKNCAQRIRDVAYSAEGSRFKLGDDDFRNSAGRRIQCAQRRDGGDGGAVLRCAEGENRQRVQEFSGIARRQEVRGEARGVKVIDDFGHHPTAIAQTLQALRHRFRGQRLWAIFEPRSNTTRRAVFQQQLPEALKLADGVFISQVARLEQIPEEERLNPESGRGCDRQGRAGRRFTSRMPTRLWIESCRCCGQTTSWWFSATAGSTISTRSCSRG